MTELIQYTMMVLGLGGVIYGIFKGVRDPQAKNELADALTEKEMGNKATILAQKEVEAKAVLLAEQLRWEKDSNEKKFKELSDSLAGATALSQNHISHIDAKIDGLTTMVNTMNINITKEVAILSTKLDERFK